MIYFMRSHTDGTVKIGRTEKVRNRYQQIKYKQRAILKPRYWAGSGPTNCDVCKRALRTVFTDGRIYSGHWAFTCDPCASTHGVTLGLGRGQRYEKQEDGRWMKVGG